MDSRPTAMAETSYRGQIHHAANGTFYGLCAPNKPNSTGAGASNKPNRAGAKMRNKPNFCVFGPKTRVGHAKQSQLGRIRREPGKPKT